MNIFFKKSRNAECHEKNINLNYYFYLGRQGNSGNKIFSQDSTQLDTAILSYIA